ncbi:hypothetical protein [Maridesulfovibrio ferrireducens]|uniref:hypothetical protein n=1 Tax=Maridesulfovibrio ferrireducens TaxID=246191 RepID=UPI001A34C14E|nr:hypothetical protein [Maridesulfovibrio ferrireducens]MBI9110312.1 hypothetical protein [Maridesulfovibrio ferrireducens]
MKIYNRVVIDMVSGIVEQEDSYEHSGPVALCKGSGGGGDSIDEEYNDRMATIYESQQDMAGEYFDFWKTDYQPMEREQIAANRELIPHQTALAKDQIISSRELLPLQTETSKKQLNVRQNFMDEAQKGIDVNSRVSQAEADVKQGYGLAGMQAQRNFSRSGQNVNSGHFAGMQKDLALSQAQSVAGARTKARSTAKDENFNRLKSASSFGLG